MLRRAAMAAPLRLSVLDLSPIPAGASPGEALRATIALARHVERLGFTRYWLAEHHNAGGLAGAAPEIMIGQVAAATSTLRVGSGGIMLPNHSALKVAEVFRLLHALFPGRIDLGLGRAAGTDPRTARRLRRSEQVPNSDDFPAQVDELMGYLDEDGTPRDAWSQTTVAIPIGVPSPELWILGSTDGGARFAAERGLGFAFAHHFNPDEATAMLRDYRARFQPSARRSAPHAILAVSVVCAESEDEARDLASSSELSGLRMAQGRRDLPLPTVEEALAYRYDEDEDNIRSLHRGNHLVGSVTQVRDRLSALVEASGADEVMVQSHIHNQAARQRSYSLLAAAFGIAAGA